MVRWQLMLNEFKEVGQDNSAFDLKQTFEISGFTSIQSIIGVEVLTKVRLLPIRLSEVPSSFETIVA